MVNVFFGRVGFNIARVADLFAGQVGFRITRVMDLLLAKQTYEFILLSD